MKMINWKTTASGLAAGIPLIIDGISKGEWMMIAAGVALILLGLAGKDYNVTGGTTRQ